MSSPPTHPAGSSFPPLTLSPRIEAQAFEPSQLTAAQKQVAGQVAQLLRGMCEQAYEPLKIGGSTGSDADKLRLVIDLERRNQVALVDGRRGSGKTSVLLTMLNSWRLKSLLTNQSPDWRDAGQTAGEDDFASNPQGLIVPIGLVDLQPLADSTNVLQLIAGHFAYVVDMLEGGSEGGAGKTDSLSAAWQAGLGRELPSRAAWRQLVRTIAGGWDRNLEQRAAQLDLESYTLEFEQMGRHRLDLTIQFRSFIDVLIADLAKRHRMPPRSAPLFVLALDDADMVPQRAVELLWTVRALWHPRVAFLLTGDSDLFRIQLRQRYLKDLRLPKRNASSRTGTPEGLSRFAANLANDVYEKIIPPHHRIELARIEPRERLEFDFDLPKGSGKNTLRSLLAQIVVTKDDSGNPYSLGRYFDADPELAEALPERARRLYDFGTLLKRAAVQSQHTEDGGRSANRAVSEVVLTLWRTALLSEDPALVPYLERCVEMDGASGALVVDTTRLDIQPEVQTVEVADSRSASDSNTTAPSVCVFNIKKLQAKLLLNENVAVDTGRDRWTLVPEVGAALRLAANVAADQDQGQRESAPRATEKGGFVPWFVAGELVDSDETLLFPWPLPQELPFIELAVLDVRWKALLRSAKLRDTGVQLDDAQVDWLARAFIHLIIATVQRRRGTRWKNVPQWRELNQYVRGLLEEGSKQRTRHEKSLSRWLRNLMGVLLAPESGLLRSKPYGVMADEYVGLASALSMYPSIGLKDQRLRRIHEGLQAAKRETTKEVLEKLIHEFQQLPGSDVWNLAVSQLKLQDSDRAQGSYPAFQKLLLSLGLHEQSGVQWQAVANGRNLNPLLEGPQEQMLSSYEGTTPARIAALWNRVCDFTETAARKPLVSYQDGALLVSRSAVDSRLTSQTYVELHNDGNRHVVLATCQLDSGASLSANVYRMIWDYQARQLGPAEPILPRGWPGFGFRLDGVSHLILWPIMKWHLFEQVKRFCGYWNDLLANIPFRLEIIRGQEWIDMIAFCFVNEQLAIGFLLPDVQPQLKVTAADWKRLIDESPTTLPARPRMPHMSAEELHAWWSNLPLMACPESGLSHQAAEGLLALLPSEEPARTGKLAEIWDLRIQRLVALDGKSEGEAADILDAVDDADATHPWAGLFFELRHNRIFTPTGK